MFTMFKLLAMAVTLSLLATSSVNASEPGSGPNPYYDCGIGGALFPDKYWAAAISNVIFDLGSTAITSATLSPETCSAKNMNTAQFIINNYDNLAEETARGQGEHLTAMLTVRGCDTSAHPTIVRSIRSMMSDNVAASGYSALSDVDKAAQYYQAMEASVASMASSCSS